MAQYVVDMKIDAVREAVLVREESPAYIYRSSIAVDYDPEKAR